MSTFGFNNRFNSIFQRFHQILVVLRDSVIAIPNLKDNFFIFILEVKSILRSLPQQMAPKFRKWIQIRLIPGPICNRYLFDPGSFSTFPLTCGNEQNLTGELLYLEVDTLSSLCSNFIRKSACISGCSSHLQLAPKS